MKKIYLLLSVLAGLQAQSQRVDLDRYYFTATYRDLPRISIDTSFRTFSVKTALSEGAGYMLRNEPPSEALNIVGWRRVPSQGDLRVDVQLDDIAIDNSEVKEREEILKDKKGVETGRRYYYHMELRYTFAARMQVNDRLGNHIFDQVLSDRFRKKVYNTKEFASSAEALNSFVSNVVAVTTSITSLEANLAMNSVNGMLNSSLGFCPRTVGDYVWILDSKKHPEYRAHRQAWTSFKQAMYQMRADRPLQEIASSLQPVIDYLNRMKFRYNSDSKGDRKMRYASYYDLAKIYYYLDRPDESLREAGQLMINNYDERDGRTLEAAALDLKKLFELNQITTRHFPVENDAVQTTASAGY